jgi:hypothetical protein
MDPLWLLLLPVAFAHGFWLGKTEGIKIGAAGMFDQLWRKGTPTDNPRIRTIEVENG